MPEIIDFATGMGPKGNPGQEGPPGADGTNGTNGTNGVDGTDGVDGADGTGVLLDLDGRLDVSQRPASLSPRVMIPGRYYGPPYLHATGTTFPTLNALHAHAFMVPHTVTLDRIAVEVTTASASGTVRLGIYSNDPLSEKPLNLVLDAGSASTTTTGAKEITINQVLQPGLYWLAAVTQGVSATFRSLAGFEPLLGQSSVVTVANSAQVGWLINGAVAGALPATPVPGSMGPSIGLAKVLARAA